MAKNKLTYKVRCRVCGTIREFVFYSNTDPKYEVHYSDFLAWVNEHAYRPLLQSCVCSTTQVSIQDLISFSKEDSEYKGKFDYDQIKHENPRRQT